MKKRCLVFFILIFNSLFGQVNQNYVDSLKTILKTTTNDSTKARMYIWIENATRHLNPEQSIKYLDSGLIIVKNMNWTKGYAIYYNDMGVNYNERSIYDKALEYYHKSLDYSEDLPAIRILTLINIALLYSHQNNDSLAHIYNEKVLPIAKKENLKREIGLYYSNASYIESDTLKKQAFLKKAIPIYTEIEDSLNLATSYYHLGEILNHHRNKLYYLKLAQRIFDKVSPTYSVAVSNRISLAEAYLLLAQNDSIKKILNNTESKKSLLDTSESFIMEAKNIAEATKSFQNLFYTYGVLSKIKKEKGDFEGALKYAEMNYARNDSLFSQENKNKIASLENQKEIALRDNEIQVSALQLQAQKKQQIYLSVGLALLTIIGVLLYYQSQARRKNNQKLRLLNQELHLSNKVKARFFSILNHDLRGPVANLIHFLHLQKNNPEIMDETTRKRLESKTISGAENLLASMEDMLLWSKGQMENFKPEPKSVRVEDLFVDNRKAFSGYQNIQFEYHNPDNIKLFTDENYLKTIMRNLTSNAINIMGNTQAPTIIWKAWQENNQKLLSITDNGRGANQEQFKALYDENEVVGIKSGLGLHLIRDLSKSIDCEIKVDSQLGIGTTFKLLFK